MVCESEGGLCRYEGDLDGCSLDAKGGALLEYSSYDVISFTSVL